MNDAATTNATTNPSKSGETALELKPADGDHHQQGEAEILVSEFPPPPYYFSLASKGLLEPPAIPVEALKYAARKAAAMAAEAERSAEAERFASLDIHSLSASAAGAHQLSPSVNNIAATSSDKELLEGDVVAVFSEIVEDPMLFQVEHDCENPTAVRDRLKQ
jgi:hypothetical protein